MKTPKGDIPVIRSREERLEAARAELALILDRQKLETNRQEEVVKATAPREWSNPRKGRGKGSLGRHADGYWKVQWSGGTDHNGKRIRKSFYGKTPEACWEKLDKFLKERETDGQ